MRQLILAVFVILLPAIAEGQPAFSYGGNIYYGGLFRYKPEMPPFQLSNLYGAEVYFLKQTDGSRYWEKKYNYPKLGLALSYFNYGEPQELGEVASLTGFIDAHLKRFKSSEIRFNFGTGIVYSTVKYHSETNADNKAIGSSISYVLRGGVYYTKELSNKWDLNLNFIFRHYSNGRMNMPNNGMNFPAVGAGITYSPKAVQYQEPEEEEHDQRLHISLYGATAWREVYYNDYKHKAYSVSLNLSKRITWYNSISIGVDGFHYSAESIRRHFTPRGIMLEHDEIDPKMAGLTVGNELYFGKLSFLIQAGFYIYDPHKIWDRWYQRYALKYYLHKNGFVQIGLKSHTRTANMVEWGIGLHF